MTAIAPISEPSRCAGLRQVWSTPASRFTGDSGISSGRAKRLLCILSALRDIAVTSPAVVKPSPGSSRAGRHDGIRRCEERLGQDSARRSAQIERLALVDTGRRRRWSEDEKLKIVLESLQAPRQGAATARRYGVSRSLLRW